MDAETRNIMIEKTIKELMNKYGYDEKIAREIVNKSKFKKMLDEDNFEEIFYYTYGHLAEKIHERHILKPNPVLKSEDAERLIEEINNPSDKTELFKRAEEAAKFFKFRRKE